jgi:hypothetical protein
MELALEGKLTRKLNMFKVNYKLKISNILINIVMGNLTYFFSVSNYKKCLFTNHNDDQELSNKSRGQLNFDWHNCHYIQNKEQFIEWKQRLGGHMLKGGSRHSSGGKREVLDVFKSVQVRVVAISEDIKKNLLLLFWHI